MTDTILTPLHGDRGESVARPVIPANPTIAISREAGARGGSIARRISKRLGWQVYDRELLEFLCATDSAREPILADLAPEASEWVESQLRRIHLDGMIDLKAEGGIMPRLILSLASRGQIILVGRGAGYYLPRESSLHVRIVAPLDDRIAHMADWSRLSRNAAAEQVRQRDERRAEFLLSRFRRRTTDLYDHDLILNTGLLKEEACADVILAALNGKQDTMEGDSRLD